MTLGRRRDLNTSLVNYTEYELNTNDRYGRITSLNLRKSFYIQNVCIHGGARASNAELHKTICVNSTMALLQQVNAGITPHVNLEMQ